MRKSIKKLVLSRETLKTLSGVVGGKLAPLTNAQRVCNTVQPCTGDCATAQTCATQGITWCGME